MKKYINKLVHWTKQFIEDPEYKLCQIALRFASQDKLSDRMVIKYQYHCAFGCPLNLKHPKTFNEKLQWLKLHDHNPLYTTLVDKYRVKEWVAEKIGPEYVIPTLAVYQSVDEINLDKLPNQFVLKCNHDSGSVVICRDKATFDLETAKKKLKESLTFNWYVKHREWAYKNVKPLVFAEQFMEDKRTGELQDYKFFSFDGMVKALFIATERQGKEETKFDFFDMDFRHIDVTNGHPNADKLPAKPDSFDKMVQMANELSKDIPEVRVDFYEVNGRSYFGEMTFYHFGGLTPFNPMSFDTKMGEYIDLQRVMKSRGGNSLVDYKIFCFNGEPKFMYIGADKAEHPTSDFFDMEFNHLPIRMLDPNAEVPPEKPKEFEELKRLATILCKGIPHVRVDFYVVNGHIYFGEMTFYHMGGFTPIRPFEWNIKIGDWIELPKR